MANASLQGSIYGGPKTSTAMGTPFDGDC